MKELIRANPKDLGKLPEPTGFTDLVGAKAWLAAQLQAAAIPNTELWLKHDESQSPRRVSAPPPPICATSSTIS